ncbi:MAG: hypothetical protein KIT14_11770 [bacterium]|nr:hypothetical protein [bacterium]
MRRVLAVLVLGLAAASPAAPPPDCTTATGVAKLLCADPTLAGLDRSMAEVLPEARAAALPGERERLDEQQRAFVERRDACLTHDDPPACVAFAYELRLAELRIRYGLVQAFGSETWECGDGSLVLVASYGEAGGPGGAGRGGGPARPGPARAAPPAPTVALTRGDRKVVAVLRPSEHGVRYEAEGAIAFWVRDAEATVRWAGKQLTCTRAGR